MGWFGKRSNKGDKEKDIEPGAVYVQGMNDGAMPTPAGQPNDDNLPVAIPIEAECVAATTPVKYDDRKPAAVASLTENPGPVNMQNDARFGRHPCRMAACPHCGMESRTKVRTFPNWITWALSLLLLFLFWPLCWVPLVVDRLKQTDHFCALCNNHVGTVQPFEDCFEKLRH